MQGGYRPCNRIGITSSTSAFLKITFETAAAFLTQVSLLCHCAVHSGPHEDHPFASCWTFSVLLPRGGRAKLIEACALQATLAGTEDTLTSPAARIVAGRAVQLGTGSFDLLQGL